MKKITHAKFLLIATFLVISSSSVFAQVKIGTNPTTIEAASNLEVQASTANRQFKVDKTSGQVTVTDGTQGVNKLLTSDAAGGASWDLIGTSNLVAFPKGKMVAGQTSPLVSGVPEIVYFSSNAYTIGGVVRAASSDGQSLKVPIEGLYLVTQSFTFTNEGCGNNLASTARTSATATLYVNAAVAVVTDDRTSLRINDKYTLSNATPLYLTANSVLAVTAYSNFTTVAGCTTRVADAHLAVTYLP